MAAAQAGRARERSQRARRRRQSLPPSDRVSPRKPTPLPAVCRPFFAPPLGPETSHSSSSAYILLRVRRIYGDHRHPKGSLASGGHVYSSLSHSALAFPRPRLHHRRRPSFRCMVVRAPVPILSRTRGIALRFISALFRKPCGNIMRMKTFAEPDYSRIECPMPITSNPRKNRVQR